MLFLALLLLDIGEALLPVTSANDIPSFTYVYLVGVEHHIEKLNSKYERVAFSDKARRVTQDVDMLPGGNKLVSAVWSDPPFEIIDANSLETVPFHADLSRVRKGTSGCYPKFIRGLTKQRFYYSGWPEDFVLDIDSGKVWQPGRCQANAKDDLFISPDRELMLNLSKDGKACLCNLAEVSVEQCITSLFPDAHSWVAQLHIDWKAPSLHAVYVLSEQEGRVVDIRIDWSAEKAERADGKIPENVARIMKMPNGKAFLAAYARGARSGQTRTAIYGRLAAALDFLTEDSLLDMPSPGKYPVKAYLSEDGRTVAFVVLRDKQKGTEHSAASKVTFIDLPTGQVRHTASFPELLVSVLFDSSKAE